MLVIFPGVDIVLWHLPPNIILFAEIEQTHLKCAWQSMLVVVDKSASGQ